MKSNGINKSLSLAFKSLINAIQSLNDVIPHIAAIIFFISIIIIFVLSLSVKLMMTFMMLIVLFSSLLIYFKSNNFGEAALALVAGLLTIFTVEWTAGRFIAFSIVWIAFTIFVIIISSVRVASKTEEIYRQASLNIEPNSKKYSIVEERLKEIGKSTPLGMLGPVERAESIRILAFRKIPIDIIKEAMNSIETLTVVTMVNHKIVTGFIADIYKISDVVPNTQYDQLLKNVIDFIRQSPSSPNDYFEAFNNSKRIILSRRLALDTYFEYLKNGLDTGVSPKDTHSYIWDRIRGR